MDIKALWGRKVAGIPVPYLALFFVAVLAVIAWRLKSTPSVSEDLAASEDSATGDAGVDNVSPTGGFAATPTPVYTTPTGEDLPAADTNDKWLLRAAQWASSDASGLNVSMNDAYVALAAYLNGTALSTAQARIRDAALKQFGYPPESVPAVDVPGAPTGGQTPAPPDVVRKQGTPPCFHTVKGSSDNTYTKLAALYYGRSDDAAIDRLQSYNLKHGHAGPFPVGTKLWIPAWITPKYVTAKKGLTTASQIIAANPPLNSVKMLQELNDGMHFPVPIGTHVRVL